MCPVGESLENREKLKKKNKKQSQCNWLYAYTLEYFLSVFFPNVDVSTIVLGSLQFTFSFLSDEAYSFLW